MKIRLYQTDKGSAFVDYDTTCKLYGCVDLHGYQTRFAGNVDFITKDFTMSDLEKLYELFNVNPPEKFTGRSMSVSDIIVIEGVNPYRFFFCDNVGFRELRWAEPDKPGSLKMQEVAR